MADGYRPAIASKNNLLALPLNQHRRLEDRIQDLVKKVCSTDDTDEAHQLLIQLRDDLQEHIKRLRKVAADKLLSGANLSRNRDPGN
jgi:uncharacterized protein YpbB